MECNKCFAEATVDVLLEDWPMAIPLCHVCYEELPADAILTTTPIK